MKERWGHRDGITGYDIALDGVTVATNHPTLSYKFEDLDPSHEYVISVTPRNTLGAGVDNSMATLKVETKSASHQEL